MTFGPHHYVPVLKVKRGEKIALQRVADTLRPRITPLLEIVARPSDKSHSVESHLDNAFKNLAESVASYSRCFLDTREIAADGQPAADEVFERASRAGIVYTPVTGVSRTADVFAALAHRTHGLALRVTRAEFEAGRIGERIESFTRLHHLEAVDVDLIIDLGAVEEMIAEGIAALTEAFMGEVPMQEQWRTLTVSACAFPRGLGGVARHSYSLVERADWTAWKDHLLARREKLTRLPTFSDCAIQHPSGVEGFDPRMMQVSATIRYTTDETWLLIKGESTRNVSPSRQFPTLATRLVYGHYQGQFFGPDHCDGCLQMQAAADGAPRLGSAEAWRRLGTIHHLSLVTQSLDAVPWP